MSSSPPAMSYSADPPQTLAVVPLSGAGAVVPASGEPQKPPRSRPNWMVRLMPRKPPRPLPPQFPCYWRRRGKYFEAMHGQCVCGSINFMSDQEKKEAKKKASEFLEYTPEFKDAVARCQTPEDDHKFVCAGTFLWKVRSKYRWYRRRYVLDPEDGFIRYEPSHKRSFSRERKDINLSHIVDVRSGWKTDSFNRFAKQVAAEERKEKLKKMRELGPARGDEDKPLVDEAACFSLVLERGSDISSLDLVAESPELANLWVRALQAQLVSFRTQQHQDRFNRMLSEQFARADKDKSGTLTFQECNILLKHLNVELAHDQVLELFNRADTKKHEGEGEPSLDETEFIAFYQMLMSRPEVEDLYYQYSRGNEMTCIELLKFLRKEQCMKGVTLEDCRALLDVHEHDDQLREQGLISVRGFTNLLLSEQCQIFNPEHSVVFQDMTQPLSSYYIACSHNTYLMGRQIVAESTIEGYIQALLSGCRCLELDCWDGNNGEPVVMHGYALTSKILFRDVLADGILPNAFLVSEYPIILSIENHCSAEQQKRMAFHFVDVFGDFLYTEPVDPDMETLPSPEQLKRKIIIKNRKGSKKQNGELDDGEKSSSNTNIMASQGDLSKSPHSGLLDEVNMNGAHSGSDEMMVERHHAMEQTLSDLVNICQATHFKGYEPEGKCYEIVSLSESKALTMTEYYGWKLVKFNTKQLCKVYPAGTRTDSSNFRPLPFWCSGCQLLALNYQSPGKPMLFNEAKFRVNGGCGYVLKPDFLRLPDFAKYDYDPSSFSVEQLVSLKDRRRYVDVKVISAQQLPRSFNETGRDISDPYVKVKIIGLPVDKCLHTTRVIYDNGFNPRWNESFRFLVNLPEVAFLLLVVKNMSNKQRGNIMGYSAVPLSSVAQGYRHVPLYDLKRFLLEPASLFVNIKITEVRD